MAERVHPKPGTSLTPESVPRDITLDEDWLDRLITLLFDLVGGEAIAQHVDDALSHEETVIGWPALWSEQPDGRFGPGVADPLMLDLSIQSDLFEDADNPLVYRFGLRESLSTALEWCADDGSGSDELERIAAELRKLSDDIDAAVAEGRAQAKKRS
jgi:hypothetical protein